MAVINKTAVSLKRINQIIRFVKPPGIKLPTIYIRTVKTLNFNGYFDLYLNKIYVSVGERGSFPQLILRNNSSIRKGYLSGFKINSQEEALVYVLAHELRHSWQSEYPYLPRLGEKFRNRVWSERDTDTYALWKLKNWRKKKKKFALAKIGSRVLKQSTAS